MGGLRVYKSAGETDRRHLRGALVQTVSDYIFLPMVVVNLISSSVLGVTGPNFMLAHTGLWMLNSLSFVSSIQALFNIVGLSSVLLHRWQSCRRLRRLAASIVLTFLATRREEFGLKAANLALSSSANLVAPTLLSRRSLMGSDIRGAMPTVRLLWLNNRWYRWTGLFWRNPFLLSQLFLICCILQCPHPIQTWLLTPNY